MADCSELCGKPWSRHAMVKQFIYQGRPHLNYAHNACNGNLTGIRELLFYSGNFVISREKDSGASSLVKKKNVLNKRE